VRWTGKDRPLLLAGNRRSGGVLGGWPLGLAAGARWTGSPQVEGQPSAGGHRPGLSLGRNIDRARSAAHGAGSKLGACRSRVLKRVSDQADAAAAARGSVGGGESDDLRKDPLQLPRVVEEVQALATGASRCSSCSPNHCHFPRHRYLQGGCRFLETGPLRAGLSHDGGQNPGGGAGS
jgi:hypothetical protein